MVTKYKNGDDSKTNRFQFNIRTIARSVEPSMHQTAKTRKLFQQFNADRKIVRLSSQNVEEIKSNVKVAICLWKIKKIYKQSNGISPLDSWLVPMAGPARGFPSVFPG